MLGKKSVVLLISGLFVITGCSKYVLVSYDKVEKTNGVELVLNSGEKVRGTIFKKEPHQLSVLNENNRKALISKGNIVSIKRLPPVYDSFGKGISELEIAQVKTSKNALIYGIGGGALSMGATFFLGSMLSADSTKDAKSYLAGTMGGLGVPGTILFIKAGAAKDRKDAIAKINQKRISVKLEKSGNNDKSDNSKQLQLQQEKEKQAQMRKEREKLLKQINKKKKK